MSANPNTATGARKHGAQPRTAPVASSTSPLTRASGRVAGGQPRRIPGECHDRSGRGSRPSGTAHPGSAGADSLHDSRMEAKGAADSLSAASSTPPPATAKGQAAGLSVPPEVAAIERMTREILAMEQRLVMLRDAAARVADELEQLTLERAAIERAAIERALEVQRVLREELAPRGQDALAQMIVEDAEAAMAVRRVS